jgi:hypothetical protein
VVVIIAGVVAAILALHIVFVLVSANGGNAIVSWVAHAADTLSWVFKDLFTPSNQDVRTLLNYGVPALVYLALGNLVARLVHRT